MTDRPDPATAQAPAGRWHLPLLLTALVLLFLPGLGLRDWWYPDEPDVVLPAIEMEARSDWVVPSHNGKPWLDYPPLAYWGARLGGVMTGSPLTGPSGPFASRLPMLAFAALLVAVTVWIGRRRTLLPTDGPAPLLAGTSGAQAAALLAGLVLLATPTLWFHATNLQVDLGYAAFQALGLYLYLRGHQTAGAAGWGWRIAGFAAFGVAILGKGPLGVLLPGLILTIWHAWNREWLAILRLAPLALVSVLVALPWYLALSARLGSETVLRELYLQNFDRFGTTDRGHGGKGLFYYFTRIPADLGLWLVVLVPALVSGFRRRRDDRTWRLLVVWVLAPLAFFTLASTKRNVYLLPVYPAMALLCAEALVAAPEPWLRRWLGWALRGIAGLLPVLGLVLLLAAAAWSFLPVPRKASPEVFAALRPAAGILGLWLVLAGGWSLRRALRPAVAGQPTAWVALAGTLIAGYALVMVLVLPVIDRQRSYVPAATWLAGQVPAGEPVGFFAPGREGPKRPAWLCHLDGRKLVFFASANDAAAWLAAAPGRRCLSLPPHGQEVPGAVVIKEWPISSETWIVLGWP